MLSREDYPSRAEAERDMADADDLMRECPDCDHPLGPDDQRECPNCGLTAREYRERR